MELAACPEDVFLTLMDVDSRVAWDVSVSQVEVLQRLDATTDVLRMEFYPLWRWPRCVLCVFMCLCLSAYTSERMVFGSFDRQW